MSSAATGSLGALLMIAPLAAIPVFAIVGVPSIGSMVAAPTDELEVSDYEPVDEKPSVSEDKPLRRNRNNLFEPYESTGRDSSRKRPRAITPPGKAISRGAASIDADLGPDDVDEDGTGTARPAESRMGMTGSAGRREFDAGLLSSEGGAGRGRRNSDTNSRRSASDELAMGMGNDASHRVLSEDSARWMKARERIRQHNITWHQLSPEEDREGNLVFVFTCFVTAPGEPSHRYHASGKTPLDAVESTLRKIDDFRREFP